MIKEMRLRSIVFASSVIALGGCNEILDFGSYTVRAPETVNDGGIDAGDAGPVQECTVNQDCISKLGDFTICRKSDFKCAKLLTPDCTAVAGDWKNDNAIVLGAVVPLQGPDKGGGIPRFNSMTVAIDDFRSGSSGLPPAAGSTDRRPLAIVGCTEQTDDTNDTDAPTRSAKHLVENVKVPAIIGAAFSGNTQKVAQVTIPAGVFLMSPTATSVVITNLQDNGLVWRTSPSDVIQASALISLMPQIEAATRDRMSITAGNPLRVLVLHKGDSYGKGLGEALQAGLAFNGKTAQQNLTDGTLKAIDYGDPNDPSSIDYNATRAQVTGTFGSNQQPHVIFNIGTAENVDNILVPLEAAAWPGGLKPTWLFADAGLIPEVPAAVMGNTDLRRRLLGTVPGSDNAIYRLFKSRYESFIKDGTGAESFGTGTSYDALYLIAYAIAATSDKPLTGANIAEGMKRLVPPGPESKPGSTNINAALATLISGGNLDFNGASGPLDFDLATGEAPSDIQIWCLPTAGAPTAPATAGIPSGIFYDALTKTIAGGAVFPPSSSFLTTCKYQ